MTADQARQQARLRITLLGNFAVERNGAALPVAEVGSRKARTVLKILAAHRGRTASMDSLVTSLWGDAPPADAAANVATLVSRLRASLGAGVIDGSRVGYRLVTGSSVVVDLDEAAALVAEADARLGSGQPALATVAANAAVALLGPGTVLEDEPDADVGGEAGREAERLSRWARSACWRAAAAVGDHRRALAVATDATVADPLDEEAHRAIMLAYHRLGEPGEALAAYERVRTVLIEELGADAGPETQRVYRAVLRGEPVEAETPSAQQTVKAGEASLVGRADEVEQMVGSWAAAARGATTCVLVCGEAGIGKTTLAGELVRQAQAGGAMVLTARCYEAERSLFLQPVLDLVRAATAAVDPDHLREAAGDRAGPLGALVPEMNRLLRPTGYQPALPELERRRTFEAVTGFLVALARQRPLLVVLDDLHLAGASTIELLHFLLRWEPAVPLLVLATLRAEEADEALEQLGPVAAMVELGPLPEPAVVDLATRMGVRDRAPEVLSLTRGHTLFVVETLRTLTEGADNQAMPVSLQAAVVARARRWGPGVEEMLRVAAVAGSSVDIDEIADLADQSGEHIARCAERAHRARLLTEVEGRYEFENELVRAALYETTPLPTRVLRHRRLAQRCADRPEAAASHAAAAGQWQLAVTYWMEAARRAASVFANREAEALLTQALEASALIDAPSLAAHAQFDRGRARLALGHYESATADLATAQQLASALGDSTLEAAAVEQLAWAAYHARDGRASPLAERAVRHPSAGAGARVLWGRVRNMSGHVVEAIDALEHVVASADEIDPSVSATATSYLATALCHADRFGEAARVADEAMERCRHTGALRAMLSARMFGAMARANLGEFGAALELATRLRDEAQRFDAQFYRPRALNILAWIWRELGRPELARDLATEAFEACSRGEGRDAEREPAANALLALADSAVLAGDPATATDFLSQIDPLLSRGVAYAWRIELRQIELLARLDPPRAEELRDVARHRGSTKYEALALARLGRPTEAAAVAARTGSDWLLAAVATPDEADRAVVRLAERLPPELRSEFLAQGALTHRRQ